MAKKKGASAPKEKKRLQSIVTGTLLKAFYEYCEANEITEGDLIRTAVREKLIRAGALKVGQHGARGTDN